MIILQDDMISSIQGIIYFKNEQEEIYATLNTYTNLYSYMKDLSKDNQEFFNDLAHDTKNEEDVFIYIVKEELLPAVDDFLSSGFERTNHYDWFDEND